MFKLNKMTDYAVVMMAEMGRADGSVRNAVQIANSTGVPLPTVAKLLKALAQAELMESQRGAGGGYCLGRRPERISVAEIIVAVEGPIALTACVHGSPDHCGVETICAMRGNWDKVNRAVRAALESVTLADMMASPFSFADSRPAGRPESRAGAVS